MFHFSSPTGYKTLTFRHFGRKGYSLFAAMGREVKVGVLSVATLSTAAPALAAANGVGGMLHEEVADSLADAAAPDVVIGEAEVTGSRTPMAANVAARTVMTFSRDDIAAAGVTSLNDVIKLCAGVDVRQRGAFGVQTDVSINGGTFDQITILLNGVNISSPHTGHLSADFPVTAQDIERIEVLEGAAARVYGTQAFTGAINIVTRREQRGAAAHLYSGMYGYGGGEGRLSLSKGISTNHISAGYTRSDGATDNSQFASTRAFLQGGITARDARLDYQLGYSYKPYGANTFYGAASTEQWESNERWMGALRGLFVPVKGHDGGLSLHSAPSVYWNRWFDHYQWRKDSPAGENFHQVDVYGLALNNWVDWPTLLGPRSTQVVQKTSFGIEMRSEGIRSTKLGELLEESRWTSVRGLDASEVANRPADSPEPLYKYAADRTNVSGFLEHNVIVGPWTLSAGALANLNTALDTRWRFYPGIDIAYRPTARWRLFASWNTALRMPTFTDLYYSGTGIEGTRNLKPENTSDFSVKAEYSLPCFTADASVFYSHRSNMIDWVVLASRPTADPAQDAAEMKNWVYRSGNYTLDNWGLRTNLRWLPTRLWGESMPLRSVGVQYAYIHEDIAYPQPILASKYAMEYVRHKLVTTADVRLFRLTQQRHGNGALNLHLEYTYNDRVASESYGLLNANLAWEARHYAVYAEAHNVLNTTYYDFTYIRQPGLWVIGGVKLKF